MGSASNIVSFFQRQASLAFTYWAGAVFLCRLTFVRDCFSSIQLGAHTALPSHSWMCVDANGHAALSLPGNNSKRGGCSRGVRRTQRIKMIA